MKRVGAILVALVVTALVAPPASAQKVTEVKLLGINDGAVLHGATPLRAQASAASGIKQLRIEIDGYDAAVKQPEGLQQKAETSFDWDTTREIGSSAFARNGQYEIRAFASANSGGSDQVAIEVLVDNPAIAPSGLTAEVDGQAVSLRWDSNPEPDILGYVIERDSGQGPEFASRTSSTAYFEEVGPGDHAYTVKAIRSSAVSSDGIPSLASQPTVAAIAAPSVGVAGGVVARARWATCGRPAKDS